MNYKTIIINSNMGAQNFMFLEIIFFVLSRFFKAYFIGIETCLANWTVKRPSILLPILLYQSIIEIILI